MTCYISKSQSKNVANTEFILIYCMTSNDLNKVILSLIFGVYKLRAFTPR